MVIHTNMHTTVLPTMDVREKASSILILQLLLNPSLPECQTIADLSKAPLLLLNSICPSSFSPLLYLFPPFLFPSNAFAVGQSSVTGKQWGTVSVCSHVGENSVKGSEAGRKKNGEKAKRRVLVWWNTADILTDFAVPSLPLSKSTVTPVLLCLSPLSISVAN